MIEYRNSDKTSNDTKTNVVNQQLTMVKRSKGVRKCQDHSICRSVDEIWHLWSSEYLRHVNYYTNGQEMDMTSGKEISLCHDKQEFGSRSWHLARIMKTPWQGR